MYFSRLMLLVFSLLLGLGSALYAADFSVDKAHSSVSFKVKHLMISNVQGDFSDFDGEFEFDPKTMDFISFKGNVGVDSVDTGIQRRDNHLRSEDFFYAEKYPAMMFVMTGYVADGDEGKMNGNLTVRGTTKIVTWDVEDIAVLPKDRNGKMRVGFTMSTKVNRHDYGLSWNSIVEGFPTVGDTVRMTVEIEAHAK